MLRHVVPDAARLYRMKWTETERRKPRKIAAGTGSQVDRATGVMLMAHIPVMAET